MHKNEFEVIVIGGGVVGCGVVRDCALRGMKALLLEKRDFANGASGANMGMIHGGMRYLEYDVETTRLSCLDSGYIQKIAPFLLFRIPFITPIKKDAKYNIELVEAFFSAYDKFVPLKGGKKHTRLTPAEAKKLEPSLSEEMVGALTTDEWGINPFRLCILNVLSAQNHQAEVKNYTEVTGFIFDENKNVVGVKAEDVLSGKKDKYYSKIVVNATGAWAPEISKMAEVKVKVRPTKGINIFFAGKHSNFAVVADTIDGRQILIMPHENNTMLGCTDDDYYGNLDEVWANEDEIEYLLEAIERVLPDIRKYRMIRVMSGIRPTIYKWGKIEDKLPREHEIYDHYQTDKVEGIITVIGGKLASYRFMAEEVTDVICKKLGKKKTSQTHLRVLPGAEEEVDIEELAHKHSILPSLIKRMVSRHGCRVKNILELISESVNYKSVVCRCEEVIEAEIRYCIREEMVKTIADIRRRCRCGAGPCQGMGCTYKLAAIIFEELNYDVLKCHFLVGDFLQERWKGKYPILQGEQIKQEELSQMLYFNSGYYREILR